MDFERLIEQCRPAIERYVRFRLPSHADAEDVLQEIFLSAYRGFSRLQREEQFKPWLLGIARNKCSDYFRRQARLMEIPLDESKARQLTRGRLGIALSAVHDTLSLLSDPDAQVLWLHYFEEMPLQDIARRLNLPPGTVKSRLHYARERFKARYPYPPKDLKGANAMNSSRLPEFLPEYRIEPSALPPFPVCFEEVMGWAIVPRLDEKLSWGLYDMPSRRCTEYTNMEVVGRAQIHGIEGVEIVAHQYNSENYYRTSRIETIERRLVAQLTDSHCRILAESHEEEGVRKLFTFLDGDSFLNNWGFGPDNCGHEIHLSPQGLIHRQGSVITSQCGQETLDIVGRYTVTLGQKRYDTVCLMDICCYEDTVVAEQYLDENGRTVLWRRFNRDDWGMEYFKKPWTELRPNNERLTINGQVYVHWYDFITDYVC